jgi:serine/threonine-protein kinase HipA
VNQLLHVWLRGEHLAELEQLRNGRLRMRYDSAALDTYGIGARPLSLSLPLTEKRVQGDHLERFLDNLLPEGAVRGALEREHGIRPGDTFALLAQVGRECAGAIQLTSEEDPSTEGRLVPLDGAEVGRIVSNLPTLDPPEGEVVSASLGGIQSKVLLTLTPDGWAWPAAGAASTHIIKPEPVTDVGPADLIRWEDWTLRLARAAGLPAARTELGDFDGRLALIVERFDRVEGRRTHQEDFTQALGIASRDKYESGSRDGRLRAIAHGAGTEALDPTAFVAGLVAQVAFNLIVGNGDAHAKNYSLGIDQTATFSLTPLYDVAPVYLLNPVYQNFGHSLDGTSRLRYLSAEHLLHEAATWGAGSAVVSRTVAFVATQVRTALGGVTADGIDTGPVAEAIDDRAGAALVAAETAA